MEPEVANVIYDKYGITIMDTSIGLVVEFADDDVSHGFTISHDKLNDPASWADASKALNEWVGEAIGGGNRTDIPEGEFTVIDD